jgi:preprotein translocase subunit SecE
MARDRQRAKQRRARRRETVPPGALREHMPRPASEDRADQPNAAPDPLAHSSSEVDEVDNRIELSAAAAGLPEPEVDDDEAREAVEEALGREGGDSGDGGGRIPPVAEGGVPARRGPRPTPSTGSGPLPLRFIGFLRASWAELQRVQWPDRRHVTQATGVVLLFVVIAGAYLGVADWVAQQIVNAIV